MRWDDVDDTITNNPVLMLEDVIACDDTLILDDACEWNVALRNMFLIFVYSNEYTFSLILSYCNSLH
jgi:hypothetical protein